VARALHSVLYDMKQLTNHLTMVVGGSDLADDLRRQLVQRDIEHVGVMTHLRGVRSSLVTGQYDVFVLCIVLDERTVRQFGEEIRRLLQDHACHQTVIRSIGLIPDEALHRDALALGCDVYVAETGQAVEMIEEVAATAIRRATHTPWLVEPTARITDGPLVWSHGMSVRESQARLLATRRYFGPDADAHDPEMLP